MFALSDADLKTRILGCADGPASFNAEATRRDLRVVSCDPLYRYAASQVRRRIAETYDVVLAQTRANRDEFVWDTFGSVDALGAARMAAMRDFLEDFDAGKAQGRYVEAALPALPLADRSFDLALCSHFLFPDPSRDSRTTASFRAPVTFEWWISYEERWGRFFGQIDPVRGLPLAF